MGEKEKNTLQMRAELGTHHEQEKLTERFGQIYTFLSQLYPANWHTRFSGASYMDQLVDKGKMLEFVEQNGPFESISGHTWMMGITDHLVRSSCPALNSVLDSGKVTEIWLFHDVREVKQGDVSAVTQILNNTNTHLAQEREDLLSLVAVLPETLSRDIINSCDEFEEGDSSQFLLEVLYVRFLDTVQSGNCVLAFGRDLPQHSELIEKVFRKRTAARARALIDKLIEVDITAAKEVKTLADFIFNSFRKKGVTLNLQDLGF